MLKLLGVTAERGERLGPGAALRVRSEGKDGKEEGEGIGPRPHLRAGLRWSLPALQSVAAELKANNLAQISVYKTQACVL